MTTAAIADRFETGTLRRTPDGALLWKWIAFAFAVDWTGFAVGSLTGRSEPGNLGSAVFLAVLFWAGCERLWVRLDRIFLLSLMMILLPVLHLGDSMVHTPDGLIKHESLWFVIAIASMARIPAVTDSGVRKWLAAPLIMVVILSLVVKRGSAWDGAMRLSGLFVNPNNFGLTSFLFPMLVDPERDSLIVRLGAHGAVVLVLAVTRTSGAAVAYAIGLAFALMGTEAFRRQRNWAVPVSIGALAAAAVMIWAFQSRIGDTRLGQQALVVKAELHDVLSGEDIYFADQAQLTGQGSTSALWRLVHWRDAIRLYAGSGWKEHIFGFGVGTSEGLLGKLPHDEYLRVLLEEGAVGLAIFLYVWGSLIRRAPSSVKWIGIVVAIYSISENNLDNFPVLSALAVCLSARTLRPQMDAEWPTSLWQKSAP